MVFWSGVLEGDASDSFTITGTTPFPFDPNAGKNLVLDIGIAGQTVAPQTLANILDQVNEFSGSMNCHYSRRQ